MCTDSRWLGTPSGERNVIRCEWNECGTMLDGLTAERLAVQLPRARRHTCQKPHDLARAAVGWNFHDRKRSLLTRETLSPSRSALMRYYRSTVDQQFSPTRHWR